MLLFKIPWIVPLVLLQQLQTCRGRRATFAALENGRRGINRTSCRPRWGRLRWRVASYSSSDDEDTDTRCDVAVPAPAPALAPAAVPARSGSVDSVAESAAVQGWEGPARSHRGPARSPLPTEISHCLQWLQVASGPTQCHCQRLNIRQSSQIRAQILTHRKLARVQR